jgi:hypothetical protein
LLNVEVIEKQKYAKISGANSEKNQGGIQPYIFFQTILAFMVSGLLQTIRKVAKVWLQMKIQRLCHGHHI